MSPLRTFGSLIVILSLAACGQAKLPPDVPTRSGANPLNFPVQAVNSDRLIEQAQALNANTRTLVQASALKGGFAGVDTDITSPSRILRNLRRANATLDEIKAELPKFLRAQDAELNRLTLALAAGQIAGQTYTARVETIEAERAALTLALDASAIEAKYAAKNLETAVKNGAKELAEHHLTTQKLARNTQSIRASISFLKI
ncbi:MAG: hypothetical protein ABJL67_05830 [Sulfitobacter sp.]